MTEPRPALPEADADAVRQAYLEGATVAELALVYGVSESTVARALPERRPPGPRGSREVPTSTIVELRRVGYSWREIAAATGLSLATVRERHNRWAAQVGARGVTRR